MECDTGNGKGNKNPNSSIWTDSPNSHDLSSLAQEAELLGAKTIDHVLLKKIPSGKDATTPAEVGIKKAQLHPYLDQTANEMAKIQSLDRQRNTLGIVENYELTSRFMI